MREIKFRAIIKTPDGKIDKYPCGVFNNKIMISTTIPYYGYAYVTLTEEYGKLIGLQQYTGIKDINGNEIYEGDILKYKTLKGREKIITVWWDYEIAGFNFGNRNLAFIKNTMEVIGNIYENPELLK